MAYENIFSDHKKQDSKKITASPAQIREDIRWIRKSVFTQPKTLRLWWGEREK